MRKLLAVVATVLISAACSLSTNATKVTAPAPSPSHCADLVSAASMEGATYAGVTACLDSKAKANFGVAKDSDWPSFRENLHGSYGTLALKPVSSCGQYSGDALDKSYGVDFLSGTVYAYSVAIDPASYPFTYPYTVLLIVVDKSGLVADIALDANSADACPPKAAA